MDNAPNQVALEGELKKAGYAEPVVDLTQVLNCWDLKAAFVASIFGL